MCHPAKAFMSAQITLAFRLLPAPLTCAYHTERWCTRCLSALHIPLYTSVSLCVCSRVQLCLGFLHAPWPCMCSADFLIGRGSLRLSAAFPTILCSSRSQGNGWDRLFSLSCFFFVGGVDSGFTLSSQL